MEDAYLFAPQGEKHPLEEAGTSAFVTGKEALLRKRGHVLLLHNGTYLVLLCQMNARFFLEALLLLPVNRTITVP